MNKPCKICRVCGRSFSWRRKYAHNWDEVRYCSSACRQRGLRRSDRWLEQELLAMLERRGPGKTLCPGELARKMKPGAEEWRHLLEPVRMAARRLHHRGAIEILQSGRVIDPDTVRGPIRFRLPRL